MKNYQHRRSPQPTNHRGAFTLMEVLLVLIILVILGSMAAGLFTGVGEKARIDSAIGQVGIFKRQIRLYQQMLNNYPSSLEDLIHQPSDLRNPEKWVKLLDESNLPLDPWENEYRYAQPGSHNPDGFDVWSMGPDGVDGTEDDVGNWD